MYVKANPGVPSKDEDTMIPCPSCGKTFEPPAATRATATCPHCRRIVVLEGPRAAAEPGETGTAPFLEPLATHETPTQVGAASQTLSLPPGKRVSVAILSGPRKGEAVTLERPRLSFGRAGAEPAADVTIPDPDLTACHAVLECHGLRIVLRDLGSASGTFVGDTRVTGQREIEEGTEFRIGESTLLLLVNEP